MFEHKTIQCLVAILCIAVFVFMITLIFDEDGHSIFHHEPQQEYVTAPLDSTVQVYQVGHRTAPTFPLDTLKVVEMSNVVAVVDSDSTKRYDLYRRQQEKVTIDLEEHKEKVFFTWEDIATYFRAVGNFINEFIQKFK